MDNNKDIRNRDVRRDDPDLTDDTVKAPGDILGVSHVPAEGNRANDTDEEAHQPPLEEERSHVGSRDVTEGTTGGTGPDTGGSGVLRRGSGATGTDIGR